MHDFITAHDSEKLINANEGNYQSYVRTYAAVEGNHFQENKKIMFSISSENGISMINNCVAKSQMTEDEVLETLHLYKKAGKPVLWTVFPSKKPVNIEAIFKKKRVTHLERNALMYLDMSTLGENLLKTTGLDIREVNSQSSLKDWTKLNGICFSLTQDTQNFINNKAAVLFLDKTLPARHFIAYIKAKPVGTSSVYMANGVAGIYNVTTIPEARGRGIGEAVTKAALTHGKKAGYTYAILQATQKGFPVYKKMGFQQSNYMDYFVKFYGLSLFLIPLNHLVLTIGNSFRKIHNKQFS